MKPRGLKGNSQGMSSFSVRSEIGMACSGFRRERWVGQAGPSVRRDRLLEVCLPSQFARNEMSAVKSEVIGGDPLRWLFDASAPRLDMANAINGTNMLYYVIIFLLIAMLAGALGFLALAGAAALIARVMFVLFLVLFLLSLIRRRRL